MQRALCSIYRSPGYTRPKLAGSSVGQFCTYVCWPHTNRFTQQSRQSLCLTHSLANRSLCLFPKCYKLAKLILPTSTNDIRLTDCPWAFLPTLLPSSHTQLVCSTLHSTTLNASSCRCSCFCCHRRCYRYRCCCCGFGLDWLCHSTHEERASRSWPLLQSPLRQQRAEAVQPSQSMSAARPY